MRNLIVRALIYLALIGTTILLVSVGVTNAQRNTITIKDRQGKDVILYKESHALVIWAGNYQHWSKLNNIETEAKDVREALERQGFQVKVVPNPNGRQLSESIKTFIDEYGYEKDNRLIIFFAGHGHTRQKTKGYLVPVDAADPNINDREFLKAALSMDDINSWAVKIEAKHVLFVFDSCFSGTIFKQSTNTDARDSYIQDVMDKPVRQFLTAGDADEKVPARSFFTPLFIRALEGEADLTKDGYVTGTELGVYLRQNLSEYTRVQHPQFGTIRDPYLDQGDIVFRPTKASPSPSPRPVPPVTPPVTPLPPKSTPSSGSEIALVSSRGIDYTKLRDLLAQGKWKEADQETTDLLLRVSNREKEGWFREEDVKNLSCEDLRTMDKLWVAYSRGKFGFSVQREIYQSLGGTREYNSDIYDKFGERVGWRVNGGWIYYKDVTFDQKARTGHLPLHLSGWGGLRRGGSDFFLRSGPCEL